MGPPTNWSSTTALRTLQAIIVLRQMDGNLRLCSPLKVILKYHGDSWNIYCLVLYGNVTSFLFLYLFTDPPKIDSDSLKTFQEPVIVKAGENASFKLNFKGKDPMKVCNKSLTNIQLNIGPVSKSGDVRHPSCQIN